MIWVLRILGYPVLTFGPELTADESEEAYQISNTGGDFQLAEGESEDEYEEPEFDFGFRSPPCQA